MRKETITLKEQLERLNRLNEQCIECGSPLFYDIGDIWVCNVPNDIKYAGRLPVHLKWLNNIPIGDHVYHRNVCWKCLFRDIRTACKEQMWKTMYLKGWPKDIIDGKDVLPPSKMPAIGKKLLPLIFRGISEEDVKKNSSRYDAASLESFIKHHGEEEGRRKYEEYTAFQGVKNTYEYKRDHKGWTKEQFNEYNRSRAVTLENMQRRYGEEEGRKRFNAYCQWQAYAGCALEYFQNLYGEEEGLRRYSRINSQKVCSLESFIDKYGESLGYSKWMEHSAKHIGYSEKSQTFFNRLCKLLPPDITSKCFYATHGGEQTIALPSGKNALPDFLLGNKIIEFNGDYWHRNPKLFAGELVTEDVKLVWEQDKTRLSELEKLGYSVLVVWELDYRRDPDGTFVRCLEFLNESAKIQQPRHTFF